MVRNYVRQPGSRPYKTNYTEENLANAIRDVRGKGLSHQAAAERNGVPKATLSRKLKGLQPKNPGRPPVLPQDVLDSIGDALATCADWGYGLDLLEVRSFVKSYADKNKLKIPRFKDNLSGDEWARKFMKDQKLTRRIATNVKEARAKVSQEILEKYSANLKKVVDGVPPSNIINYDETNLTDDPGSKTIVCRRGVKRCDRVINHAKSSTSIMFSGTASGHMLPVYVVFKAQNLYKTWIEGGERQWRYNRTISGWFDQQVFEDWFDHIIIPYAKAQEGKKVIIGDNLSSHLSPKVLELCTRFNISFVFLPPNATHICQPLDVAYFKPLKTAWRKQLELYKICHPGAATLPKHHFPSQLKNVLMSVKAENIKSGFKKCGIYPFSTEELVNQLPQAKKKVKDTNANKHVAESMIEFLNVKRFKNDPNNNVVKRGKKLEVEAGASISLESLETLQPSTSSKASENPKITENLSATKMIITLPQSNFK